MTNERGAIIYSKRADQDNTDDSQIISPNNTPLRLFVTSYSRFLKLTPHKCSRLLLSCLLAHLTAITLTFLGLHARKKVHFLQLYTTPDVMLLLQKTRHSRPKSRTEKK
ncbi:hypothetical protein E2C01_063695 [Portunus trituberculatus]|uniref:Uncharacterized protein n=1 Tax=Portunus trituberculatus TaxID=210409 RepID=A0A5B7HIB7_PORTR|nr:hypothetical protein [Portunus trituberculatus]